MRQLQSVENPDKSDPGRILGRVEAIPKTRGQPRGNAPRRPHLTNRVPGAKLHGPERPNNGQEVAHERIKYLVKHLELLAADSAKPEEGTNDPSEEVEATHSTKNEGSHLFSAWRRQV